MDAVDCYDILLCLGETKYNEVRDNIDDTLGFDFMFSSGELFRRKETLNSTRN